MDVHTIFIASGGTGGSYFSRFRRRNTRLDQVCIYLVIKENQPIILLVEKENNLFVQRLKELFDKLYCKWTNKEESCVKKTYFRVFAGRKVKENTANVCEKFKLLFRLHKKSCNFAKYSIVRKKLFQKLNMQKLAAFLDKQLGGLIVMRKANLQSFKMTPLIKW